MYLCIMYICIMYYCIYVFDSDELLKSSYTTALKMQFCVEFKFILYLIFGGPTLFLLN